MSEGIFNTQAVGVQGERIVVLSPKASMTKHEALVHAAWLVALADEENKFPEILKEVQES
jgi:hypothetical protein